jgi:hypothetical protein
MWNYSDIVKSMTDNSSFVVSLRCQLSAYLAYNNIHNPEGNKCITELSRYIRFQLNVWPGAN